MIEVISYLLFLFTYLATFLINPGIPSLKYYSKNFKLKDKEQLSRYQKCTKCNIIFLKKLKVSHCSICDICIIEHDHHCPWSGKCIGKYNILYFYLFLSFFVIYFFSSFTIFLTHYIYIDFLKQNKKDKIN